MKANVSSNLHVRLVVTATLLAAATARDGRAAEPTPDDIREGVTLEELVITGSRIKRTDLDATSPLTLVSGDDIRSTGSPNVEDLLNRLPQVITGFNGASNNPSDGTATVDLRNLGSNRTLVLVNGKRFLQSTQYGTVDLNNVPTALIERVEVVTGGASAVYGSDAIAGVVNFKVLDDFEGVSVSSQYGQSTYGDADKGSVALTIGGNFADGRGNAVASVSFSRREKNLMSDRDFSYFVLRDRLVQPGTQNGSYGYSEPCNGATDCVIGLDRWGGSSATPATRITGAPGIGTFGPNGEPLPWNEDSGRYNWSIDQYLQIPQEQRLIFQASHFDINDQIRLYSSAIFSHNEVATQLPPHSATPGNALVDVDSPFLAPDAQAIFAAMDLAETGDGQNDGYAVVPSINRRMVEIGNRQQNFVRDGSQIIAGAKGSIARLNYDVYYSYARVDEKRLVNNVFLNSAFLEGLKTDFDANGNLQCADPAARARGCVPVNIFGEGNISPEAVNYLRVDTDTGTYVKEEAAGAVVDGTFRGIGIAVGAEWRKNSSEYRPGLFGTGDITGFGGGKVTAGSFDVAELYGEVRVPLLERKPFAERLDLTAGYRRSDYSTAGGVDSYAAGLVWGPIESLRLRGQYQRAVRAPNIAELFQGASISSSIASDPCSAQHVDSYGGVAAIASLCEATGVPVGQTGQYTQLNTEIRGVFGGNPDLFEESSDTWTIGAVFQPRWNRDLSVTVDYYSIEIQDAIDNFGGGVAAILSRCYGDGVLSSPFCQAIERRADGNVLQVWATKANLAVRTTSGLDVAMTHRIHFPNGLMSSSSSLGFSLSGTYVIENQRQADFKAPVIECAGNFGGPCGNPDPKWRSSTKLTYEDGGLTAALTWRYMDKVDDQRIENLNLSRSSLASPSSKAMNYFDLAVSYELDDGLELNGGINNIFNAKPSFLGDNQVEANTFPTVYDLIGTYVFVGATAKF